MAQGKAGQPQTPVKIFQVWETPANSPSILCGCVLDADQVAVRVITGEIRPAG